MSTTQLAIAQRLRALLPHVTSDPEAEVFLDGLIAEYGGAPGEAPPPAEGSTLAEVLGKWAWYEEGEDVHGPFDSREEAIADANERAAEGTIEEYAEIYVGQYAALDIGEHVPEGDFVADEIITATEQNFTDSEEYIAHASDPVNLHADDSACRALGAFVARWMRERVSNVGQTWVVRGTPVEDEIKFPATCEE